MTSLNKIRTNRLNAAGSTGPKSILGRRRSSQNARRHGLSVTLVDDPELSHQAKLLARQIAGHHEIIGERAIRVAEAQIDLIRVRSVKLAVLHQLTDLLEGEACAPTQQRPVEDLDCKLVGIDRLMKQLLGFDRYERRALSRRRKAIRSYDQGNEEITIHLA
jgi:hypothetical protein